MPKEGMNAPAITLHDQHDAEHTLAQYQGEWVLMYFYPKDDTPGCTAQACAIRDDFPAFTGVTVLGISPDTVAKHKKFAEKYKLPFTLLADPEHIAATAYGVWGPKKFIGHSYEGVSRTSFLIAPGGIIAKVYENVKPLKHASQLLSDLAELQGK